MNQKQANKLKRETAEIEADQYFDKFVDLLEQTSNVRKHGYEWENLKTLNTNDPDYKNKKSEENAPIDNSIMQPCMGEAILTICHAALALLDYGCDKRTKYFKAAVIYCSTIKAYEHVYTMSAIAMRKSTDTKFFMYHMDANRDKKNIDQDVVFDMDVLFDQLSEI